MPEQSHLWVLAHLTFCLLSEADATAGFSKPAMGFNTCSINCGNESFPNEQFMKATAELMVQRGLKDAGYEYVNMDGGWMAKDRADGGQGPQMAEPSKFPHGLRHLADYIHSLGLKFGVYTALATSTCVTRHAGSCKHEHVDAAQYGEWGVDYLKDDGCGGCYTGNVNDDPDLINYGKMQEGLNATGRKIYFSTEASPDIRRVSAQPNMYGNTHRSGHDCSPTWGSVMSEIDIASGLWSFAHNDTGNGCFFNDLDMLQIGLPGDFEEDLEKIKAHFTMWVMLKSNLLLSTRLDRLSEKVLAIITNSEAIAIHQDWYGKQAFRVRSLPPLDSRIVAPFNALMVIKPCQPGNLLQRWRFSGNGSRLWTEDALGQKWCVGEGSWARPAEVMPCDGAEYQPNSSAPCSCNNDEPCCHYIDTFNISSPPQCEAGLPTPKQCKAPMLGGMMGEGCGLTLQCKAGETITGIDFADWGLPLAAGADPLDPSATCMFQSNSSCSSRETTTALVRSLCIGKNRCEIGTNFLKDRVTDPCHGVHKRFAVRGVGCTQVQFPPSRSRFFFTPSLSWDTIAGASGPLPHSRYVGANPMATHPDGEEFYDAWYFGDDPHDGLEGRALHPSSRTWMTRDSGFIRDDDHIGGILERPASEFCAEAVHGGNLEVWTAELSGGQQAVALLNRSPSAANITVDWEDIGLPWRAVRTVRDVWAAQDKGDHAGKYTSQVPAHGVVLLVLKMNREAHVDQPEVFV